MIKHPDSNRNLCTIAQQEKPPTPGLSLDHEQERIWHKLRHLWNFSSHWRWRGVWFQRSENPGAAARPLFQNNWLWARRIKVNIAVLPWVFFHNFVPQIVWNPEVDTHVISNLTIALRHNSFTYTELWLRNKALYSTGGFFEVSSHRHLGRLIF
jgi:hypothetical protein